MRRSAAPSWRQRSDSQPKRQCTDSTRLQGTSTSCLVTEADAANAADSSSCPAEQSWCTASTSSAAGLLSVPRFSSFKCPVPGASATSGSRTLGARKLYGAGADLFKSLNKTVFLDTSAPSAAEGPTNLLLYDPEAHAARVAAAGSSSAQPEDAEAALVAAASSHQTAVPLPEQPPVQPAEQQQQQQQVGSSKVYADQFLVDMLRPHQRDGVKFIFECLTGVRKEGCLGAVLCDGMGLGKTFQTVASLWCLLTKGIDGKPTCSKPLVLCPSSLVANWGRELSRWLGNRVHPVVVDDTRADSVKASLKEFSAITFQRRNQPKVLVMSYPTFRMHQAAVYKLGIDVVMCDEAHQLKNRAAQITQAVAGLPAERRLLLSGTPIQNDLSEFHALFDCALPGLLGDLNSFRKMYEYPILRGRDADATPEQVAGGLERMNQLMDICNTFMLRRTSAVLKELLPAKVEQVVFCKLAPLQLKLYQAFLNNPALQALLRTGATAAAGGSRQCSSKAKQSTQAALPPPAAPPSTDTQHIPVLSGCNEQQQQPAGRLAPLVAITALKKLCCHPDLIYSMCMEGTQQQQQQQQQQQRCQQGPSRAPASYAAVLSSSGSLAPAAGARSSGRASSKSSSSSLAGATKSHLHGFEGCTPLFHSPDVYPAFQPGQCQPYHSGKMMVLEALLKATRQAEPTDKVVLISNYTEVLDVLERMCKSKGWSCLRLDGSCSVKQRQALVDTFNDPSHPSFVFLVSSKAGGVGLNIIGANRLVLFDASWNPADDAQAMARVWREGQRKRVWIYRLLTAGSIEEKVFQRQLAKQGLSEALMDDVGQEVRTFSAEELRSLFKVDPCTPCDTHTAIKCTCDGSAATAAAKAAAFAALAAAGKGSAAADGDGAGAAGDADQKQEQQGVVAWAHLKSAVDSPDPMWGQMGDWLRDKFVTYVMSDHVLQEQPATASAGGGQQELSEGEEEEEQQQQEQQEEPEL